MAIPENVLAGWSSRGSEQQSKATYGIIKRSLESADAPYAGRKKHIFLQGSYGNDTNIYADSDVDVVIRLDSVFYYDISRLDAAVRGLFKTKHPSSNYSLPMFKESVVEWLDGQFDGVDPGSKAVFIPGNSNRRDADVLVCAKLRRYYSYNTGFADRVVEGIRFFRDDGTVIDNFPRQHSDNLTRHHQATNEWLKPTVRIFKNMRNRMIAEGLLQEGKAPSYYLEGLLYNVPIDRFGVNYATTIINVFNYLHGADRANFLCANEEYHLLRDDSPVTWNAQDCQIFLDALAEFWNQW